MKRFAIPELLVVLTALTALSVGAAEAPFELREIHDDGRVVAADLLDLDGDGRTDLFTVSFSGLPPDETRQVRVYFQSDEEFLRDVPDWSGSLPQGSAAYDIADLEDGPGREIVLLRRRRLTVLSFPGRKAVLRDIPIPGAPTVGLLEDERGLDRLRLIRPTLGDPLRFVVPGLGEAIVLLPDGEILSRLEIGARANYFLPPRPGPLISESETEIYFDVPLIVTGDVDGDGRVDLITSTRHEIRVFLQREDGTFPERANRSVPLHRITEEDHIRGSGSVRLAASDLNGDGLVDLLISHTSGGLFRALTTVGLHLNREGTWDLEKSDQTFRTEGGFSTSQFLDLDGNGRSELLALRVPVGILDVIEFFVTRNIDAEVLIYRASPSGTVESKPSFKRNIELSFDFDTLRPRGFLPTFRADVNGDGILDFLDSGGGEELKVALGDPEWKYKRSAQMKFDTDGRIRFGDFNGDGLLDFLIYDPRRRGATVRIGINKGTLVDSPS